MKSDTNLKNSLSKTGYLYNVSVTNIVQSAAVSIDPSLEKLRSNRNFNEDASFSALRLYFVTDEGLNLVCNLIHLPYFYIGLNDDSKILQFHDHLEEKLTAQIGQNFYLIEKVEREDLSRPNHIRNPKFPNCNTRRSLLKLSFSNIDLFKRALAYVKTLKNKKSGYVSGLLNNSRAIEYNIESMLSSTIEDCYEYDVKYITRVLIDRNIRCGTWYNLEVSNDNNLILDINPIDITSLAPLNILAWDIECYKSPLKFPDMEVDPIILISFVFNGQGYLLINREYVSQDISDFSYSPSEEFSGAGPFKVFNDKDESAIITRFFELICKLGTHILVTYNGDNFDFPYLYRRAEICGIKNPIMSSLTNNSNLTRSRFLNMDCYKWVERDSYLPNGSRTLKQVTRIKLKYNPAEVDPELIVSLAINDPQTLATYSVSDSVATYYLYTKFIHNFVLALAHIIPLAVEDVLRHGSGTLCEHLLMAEAFTHEIVFPNKYSTVSSRYYHDPETGKFHLIYDDSYVGGRVETLRCGLYRDDLVEDFTLDSHAYQDLIDKLPETLNLWAKSIPPPAECDCSSETKSRNGSDPIVSGLDEKLHYFKNIRAVYDEITEKLTSLSLKTHISSLPRIIHLDVGAMYPNIILTHRLQPTAIVDEEFCSKCSYYSESNICQRPMKWKRKLEISPIDRSLIQPIKKELESRSYGVKIENIKEEEPDTEEESGDEGEVTVKQSSKQSWAGLTEREQHNLLVKAVKSHSLKTTKKSKVVKEVQVESLVCQRENPFYVDTVRKFRDRRYVFKRNVKRAEKEKHQLLQSELVDIFQIRHLNEVILLNDSLQLAHKCILNSFYGYVKRNGSRWFSMEMGAIVTFTGSQIIESSREVVDKIGTAIELDTDGIWCMLPGQFPFIFTLEYFDCNCGKNPGLSPLTLEYPTVMLNLLVYKIWSNPQYLEYDPQNKTYNVEIRNDVEFELDGPWHAMFLPASEKSQQLLKKRYVVYNHSGHISELKGFEIKRRGELQLIQRFQEEVFGKYVLGSTKQEAYEHAASVGLRWRKILENKADCINDDAEVFDLLLSKTVMKKSVEDQPGMKGFGITTAKRLSQLLVNPMYIRDSNVSTQFLIANRPVGADITNRAIPLQLFFSDETLRLSFISKWLGIPSSQASQLSSRDILDWDYYRMRLDTQLLKLISIPSILQKVNNPIPILKVPDYLLRIKELTSPNQAKITNFFKPGDGPAELPEIIDVPDMTTKLVDPEETVGQEISRLKSKWLSYILRGKRNQSNNNLFNVLKDVEIYPFNIDDLYLLATEQWHIVNLTPTNVPGTYSALVSLANIHKFFSININIERRVYIDFEGKLDDLPRNIRAEKTTTKLHIPNTNEDKHLTCLYFDETVSSQTLFALEALLHNKIKSVYESKLSLLYDFITRKGNVVSMSTELSGMTGFQDRFLLSANGNYLSDVQFLIVYIYNPYEDAKKMARDPRFCSYIFSPLNGKPSKVLIGGSLDFISTSSAVDVNSILNDFRSRQTDGDKEQSGTSTFPDTINDFSELIVFKHKTAYLGCRNAKECLKDYIRKIGHTFKVLVMLYSTSDNDADLLSFAGVNVLSFKRIDLPYKISASPNSTFFKSVTVETLGSVEKHYYEFEQKLTLSRLGGVPLGVLMNLSLMETSRLFLDINYIKALRCFNHVVSDIDSRFDASYEFELPRAIPGIYRGYLGRIDFDQSTIFYATRHFARSDPVSFKILGYLLDQVVGLLSEIYKSISPSTFASLFTNLLNIRYWLYTSSLSLNNLYKRVIYSYHKYLVEILDVMKSKFGVIPLYTSDYYVILDSCQTTIPLGRQVIQMAMNGIRASGSIYDMLSFNLTEEYVAVLQINESNYLRFRDYSGPPAKSLHHLPLLDGYSQIIQSLFMDIISHVTLHPLVSIITGKNDEYGLNNAIRNVWLSEDIYLNLKNLLADRDALFKEYLQPNISTELSPNYKSEVISLVIGLFRTEQSFNIMSDEELQQLELKLIAILGGPHKLFNWLGDVNNSKLVISDMYCNECNGFDTLNFTHLFKYDSCSYCGSARDSKLIEYKIIDFLERYCYSFINQDYYCNRCFHAKINCRSESCSCGGSYSDGMVIGQLKYILNEVDKIVSEMNFQMLGNVSQMISSLI